MYAIRSYYVLLEADDQYGKFEFRPLEPGYGITVGNALRRILLSSLEGFAITTVKIEGVDHAADSAVEFDVIELVITSYSIHYTKLYDTSEEYGISV